MTIRKIGDFPEFVTRDSITLILGPVPLSKKDFLALLAKKLRFPPYFGGNWDALADSLPDSLIALKKKKIRLIFPAVPLKSAKEMKTFLEILEGAQRELARCGVTLEADLIECENESR